jgi:four helix bundle protein
LQRGLLGGQTKSLHNTFVAHGSTAEAQSALYVALDQEYISRESFDKLYKQYMEVSRMISGLIKYLRRT